MGDDRDNYENANEIFQTIDFSAELKAEKMDDELIMYGRVE